MAKNLNNAASSLAGLSTKKIESGDYGSKSEVAREALRLHEELSAYQASLLAAIDEGLANPADEGVSMREWIDKTFPDQQRNASFFALLRCAIFRNGAKVRDTMGAAADAAIAQGNRGKGSRTRRQSDAQSRR
jgi:putative addiction module CopG family antidote